MDIKELLESSTRYNFVGAPTGKVVKLSETEALYYENGSGVGQLIGVYGDTVNRYDQNNMVVSSGSYDSYSDTVRMVSTSSGLATDMIGESEDGDIYSRKVGSCYTSTYVPSTSCSGYGTYGNYEEEEKNMLLYGNYEGYYEEDDDDY